MMVRINLLPGKRKQAKEDAGQAIQVAALLLLIAVVGICYWLWQDQKGALAKAQQAGKVIQTKIDKAKKDLSAIGNLEARKEAVMIRQLALTAITAERMGPRHVLDCLRVVMDRPRTPVIIASADEMKWKRAWDANNVTLTSFGEDPREPERVVIEGEALTPDDVAEFWLRLQTSGLFAGVQLTFTRESVPKHPDLKSMKVHSFQLVAYANFRYRNAHSERMAAAIEEVDQVCAESTAAPKVAPPPKAPEPSKPKPSGQP